MELLSPDETEESDDSVTALGDPSAAASAASDVPVPVAPGRQRSRVAPKGEAELSALVVEQRAEEQRLQAELETLQAAQL